MRLGLRFCRWKTSAKGLSQSGLRSDGEISSLGWRDPMNNGIKCHPHGIRKRKTMSWTSRCKVAAGSTTSQDRVDYLDTGNERLDMLEDWLGEVVTRAWDLVWPQNHPTMVSHFGPQNRAWRLGVTETVSGCVGKLQSRAHLVWLRSLHWREARSQWMHAHLMEKEKGY
jgi:hypothetical protein